MKRIPRSTLIPAVLLVYLVAMAYMGLPGLRSGQTSLLAYILTILATLVVIIVLHFVLRRRERLRRERTDDISSSENR